MKDPFAPLRELAAEQAIRLHDWFAEDPNADQSPDYQADLSRLERLLAAIQQAEGAAS